MEKPKWPLNSKIYEGDFGSCVKCGSSELRSVIGIKSFGIGKVIGCIQPECDNYYKGKILLNERG